MFINKLKKIVIYLFTKNPYRVDYFDNIYHVPAGRSLDQPETLTGVLSRQYGEIVHYPFYDDEAFEKYPERYIDKKPRFRKSGLFKAPDRYIYSTCDSGIVGHLGLVYDPALRVYVDESAKDWVVDTRYSPFLNAFNLPPQIKLKGVTISFLTLGADAGFYHFLFESIVKASLYDDLMLTADHLLFNGPQTSWKLKWLNRAKIDLSKIIWIDNNAHFICDQLLFTNRLVADQQVNKWCTTSLRNLFGLHAKPSKKMDVGKIIWISRKGLNKREITWDNDILSIFPEIESVDLSQLSVEETIEKMAGAAFVAGAHGAGLSNVYLCQPGTKILEIYPLGVPLNPCFKRLASTCKLEHTLVIADFHDKTNPENGLNILVDTLKAWLC